MKLDRTLNIENHWSSIEEIKNNAKYSTFEENDEGKRGYKNYFELFKIITELCLEYKLENLERIPKLPNHYLWEIFRGWFRTQIGYSSNEVRNKTRKEIVLNLAVYVQKVINSCSSYKVIMSEHCNVIKEAANEYKNKENPLKLNVDFNIENRTFEQKINILNFLFLPVANLIVYGEIDPSTSEGYKILFKSYEFAKPVLMIMTKALDEINFENEKLKLSVFSIFSHCLQSYSSSFLKTIIGDPFSIYKENINLVEKILKSLINPNTLDMIDEEFVRNTLKIICSIMGDIDTSRKNEKTDEIYRMCEDIIYLFANLKTKVGQNNCLFFLMIVQKLIDYYDQNQTLTKMSIELKIKDCFVDKKSCKLLEKVSKADFLGSRSVFCEFAINTKLFHSVFEKLCEVTEDKEFVKLNPGISIFLLLI